MKRVLGVFLIALLCLTTGCGKSGSTEPQSSPTPPKAVVSATAQPATPESFQKMNCIYDSIVRAMIQCQFEEYDPNNATCLWNAIYFVANTVGDTLKGGKVVYNEDMSQLIVPTEIMEEYAAACSSTFESLPDIPADMTSIAYSEENDEYYVICSDNGNVYYTYSDGKENSDGTYSITVLEYKNDKPQKNKYTVKLVDNPKTFGLSDVNYPYSVVFAKAK